MLFSRVVVSFSTTLSWDIPTSRLGLISAGEANASVSSWSWELSVSILSFNVSCLSLLFNYFHCCRLHYISLHHHHCLVLSSSWSVGTCDVLRVSLCSADLLLHRWSMSHPDADIFSPASSWMSSTSSTRNTTLHYILRTVCFPHYLFITQL